MEIETIREICINKEMMNYDLFVDFFSRAFPNESNQIHSYCSEWVDRFQSGNPMIYMDDERKEIYKELVDEWSKK